MKLFRTDINTRKALPNIVWTPNVIVQKRTDSFLARDAMRKRGLCCRPVSVRPSVRLSCWCIVILYRDGLSYHQTSFWGR